MRGEVHYAGAELEAMARAHNYYRWILGEWRPHLGRSVLEFGAGMGTFSAHLACEAIERLILVEPAPELFEKLRCRFGDDRRVELWNCVLQDVEDGLASSVDTVVSVNVLEHINDEAATLRAVRAVLRPGGSALIFAPALPALYGSLDRAFGHVRRYTKATLSHVLTEAGLSPVRLRYANVLGALPWLVAGRLLRRKTLNASAVALVDRTIIPVTAALERIVSPPFGQSVIAVARKTDS